MVLYCTKIKGISKFAGIVMLIGQDRLWIDAPLQVIVFSLKEILFFGKARNKMRLFDLVLKLNIR